VSHREKLAELLIWQHYYVPPFPLMLIGAQRVLDNLYYHYATVEEVINNDAAELTVTIHWYIIQGQGRISSYREYEPEPQRVPRWFYYP
jgi:hypothetical protein